MPCLEGRQRALGAAAGVSLAPVAPAQAPGVAEAEGLLASAWAFQALRLAAVVPVALRHWRPGRALPGSALQKP